MNSNIDNDLSELWGKVGFIVHLSQMVEYNLANILSADKLLRASETNSTRAVDFSTLAQKSNKMYLELSGIPLGRILKQAKKVKFFNEDEIELLEKACEKRNYVVHHLFREDLILNHLETNPQFYFEELENTIELLYKINEVLTKIFEWQKQEFRLID